MNRFTIKISYQTGNSFGSEDAVEDIGLTWENINQAEKALVCIKEHYQAYLEENKPSYYKPEFFSEESIKDKPWYNGGDFSGSWQYQIMVEKDDGTKQNISPFWCGYFETLYEAEIISVPDSAHKISFR